MTTKPQHSPEPWKWEGPRKFDHKGSRDHPAYHWHRVFMGDGSTVAYTPDASTAAVLCESERIRAERDNQSEKIAALRKALEYVVLQDTGSHTKASMKATADKARAALTHSTDTD